MSLRLTIARQRALLPLFVMGWRLGLGPILGRRLCLVTAATSADEPIRAVLPYVFAAGDLLVPAVGDRRWVDAAVQRPQVMVQAHPGPLSTRARRITERERELLAATLPMTAPDLAGSTGGEWWVLQPTGDPAPQPALPDLNWVLPAIVAAALAYRRWRCRR